MCYKNGHLALGGEMPLFRVSFMNHIVETYEVEAPDEESAWRLQPWQVDDLKPVSWDCTLSELGDVAPAPIQPPPPRPPSDN